MNKVIKIVVVAGFLAVSSFFLLSKPAAIAASTPMPDDKTKTLYEQNCAKCHGTDGKANTDKGRELAADDLTAPKTKGKTTERLISIITKGRDDMPAYEKKLTPDEIKSIAEYIKTL